MARPLFQKLMLSWSTAGSTGIRGRSPGSRLQIKVDFPFEIDLEVQVPMGFLFESLAVRDLRIYAEAADARVFHYRERSGDLEVDLVVEHPDGSWAGFEVKLGGRLVDDAAASLLRMSSRVAATPSVLAVITGTEYGYRRPDGVWVLPLGCLAP